jgi:hypothetical protein
MDRKQQLRLLALSAAVATLSACGGGGGDDAPAPGPAPAPAPAPGAPTPPPPPPPTPPPPPPPPSSTTGLGAASGTLAVTLGQAGQLVSTARTAYGKSAGGFASVNLGDFSTGIGGANSTPSCPGGGSATYTAGAAGAGSYAYNACVIDGVTYTGNAALTYTMSSGTLTQYTIIQSGVSAVVNGQNVLLDDSVACNLDGGTMLCVGHYGDNQWGNDFVFNAGTANGSYQCECNTDRWNNVYTAMTATSGQVNTQAEFGSAVINRTSATTWTVTITNGGSSQTYNVTL